MLVNRIDTRRKSLLYMSITFRAVVGFDYGHTLYAFAAVAVFGVVFGVFAFFAWSSAPELE